MDWKKALKITGIILLILAFVFIAIWVAFNWKTIFSGSKIYTSQQREEYGDQRYNAALEQAEKWRVQVQELQNKVVVYEENQNDLKVQVSTLINEKETLQNQKTTLEAEVRQKDEQIAELEQSHTNDQQEIKTLKTEKNSLEAEIQQKNAQISEKEQKITQFQTQIIELKNSVTRLISELEAYREKDIGLNKIEFINKDIVERVVYFKKGETIPYVPTLEQKVDEWFYGWTKEKGSENVFNLTTEYTPSGDETFYAVTGPTVPVAVPDSFSKNFNSYSEYGWYGENLTLNDILNFDEDIDFDDPNLTLTLGTSSRKTPKITLNTKIKDFADNVQTTYNGGLLGEHADGVYDYACSFNINLKYKVKTIMKETFTESYQRDPWFTDEDENHFFDLGFDFKFSKILGFDYCIRESIEDKAVWKRFTGDFTYVKEDSSGGSQSSSPVYKCTLDNGETWKFKLWLPFDGGISCKLYEVSNMTASRIINYRNIVLELDLITRNNVYTTECACAKHTDEAYEQYLNNTYAHCFTDNAALWVTKKIEDNSFDYILAGNNNGDRCYKTIEILANNATNLKLDLFALEKDGNYFGIIYTVQGEDGQDYSAMLLVYRVKDGYGDSFESKTLIEEKQCSITRMDKQITVNSSEGSKTYTLNEDRLTLDAA